MTRRDAWIQTFTGKVFRPFAPEPDMVCIEDIAHALAHICRFGGHCRFFWSVAQHSVCVSRAVPRELALHALLHDAAEAYVGDVVAPIKRELAELESLEYGVMRAIAAALGLRHLTVEERTEIHRADLAQLALERSVLHLEPPQAWDALVGVAHDLEHVAWIGKMAPAVGELVFLHRYRELAP